MKAVFGMTNVIDYASRRRVSDELQARGVSANTRDSNPGTPEERVIV